MCFCFTILKHPCYLVYIQSLICFPFRPVVAHWTTQSCPWCWNSSISLSVIVQQQGLPLCFSPHPRQITILTLWILTQASPYSRESRESFMNIDEGSLVSLWNLHIGLVPYIQNSLLCQWARWTLHSEGLFMRFITAAWGKSHLMHADSVQWISWF